MNKDTPSALMSAEILGAFLRGRYANRSMVMPNAAVTAKDTSPATGKDSPHEENPRTPTKAPTMKTSPWAKLMRRIIPYTMVYPSAMSEYTMPS